MVDKGNTPEILTLEETAQLLRLKVEKVYHLAESGRLPGAKVGGRWRFVRKQILGWMRKMRKRSKRIFLQGLPIICMLIAALFSVFAPGELSLVRAEENRGLRETAESEPLREYKEERPWWQFPGWETVLAIVGCLYFILAKHFFQHFLTK